MPAPLAKGIVITISVLLAASLAAYENPQVRAWIDRQRHKISMQLHALGDDIGPRPRPQPRRTSTNDASLYEEKSELAVERRRQAIADIMERGRIMEERRKRRKTSRDDAEQPPSPTFDSLVDGDGILLQDQDQQSSTGAASSAVDPATGDSILRRRGTHSEGNPTMSAIAGLAAPPPYSSQPAESPGGAFESRYEQEMREAWNLPLASRRIEIPSSHASESLIELTPTTESAPDPDFSIPSTDDIGSNVGRSLDYFSMITSNSTHTLSEHSSQAGRSIRRPNSNPFQDEPSGSTTPSISSSISNIALSDAGDSRADVHGEMSDGVRTPASAWTDVDSTVSGDFRL